MEDEICVSTARGAGTLETAIRVEFNAFNRGIWYCSLEGIQTCRQLPFPVRLFQEFDTDSLDGSLSVKDLHSATEHISVLSDDGRLQSVSGKVYRACIARSVG